MDKAAIFTEVTRRNHLRLQNHLPPLNVRQEYEFQVALTTEREFREELPELAARFAADRETIEIQVIADLGTTQGAEFRHTKAGHWTITQETNKRFRAFLREVHGIETPPLVPRHAVIYGEGAAAVLVEVPAPTPA